MQPWPWPGLLAGAPADSFGDLAEPTLSFDNRVAFEQDYRFRIRAYFSSRTEAAGKVCFEYSLRAHDTVVVAVFHL